jgi:L-fuconolactonase
VLRIDSHHHLWTYDAEEYAWIGDGMGVLKRDFSARDLAAVCAAAGVQGAVAVQARQSLEESRWLLETAESEPLVRGVVGWVPLADYQVNAVLEELSVSPWLKGVRHVVQDEPDDDFILGKEFNRGIRALRQFNLLYDILIYPKHLANSAQFVDLHPEQEFVLDHIAKPAICSTAFDRLWADNLRALAKRSNVIGCKVSGVVTEVRDADWSVDMLRPYWDVALEAFGPKRLMFGSDWPVCLLRASYAQWVNAVTLLASELSLDEQESFWSGNATRVYRLS